MKKLYSTMMMLAMMVAALSFTACGGDEDDGISNTTSASTLKIVSSKGQIYDLADERGDNKGKLSHDGDIWCFVVGGGLHYFRIILEETKSISDFHVGLDLGELDMHLAQGYYSHTNKFYYSSGSISVIANDGKGFTLKFDDYVAKRNDGWTMTVNGTLYVEEEKYY